MAIRFYPLGGGQAITPPYYPPPIGGGRPTVTPQPQPTAPPALPAPTPTAGGVKDITDIIPYLPDPWEKRLEVIRQRNPLQYAQLVGEVRKIREVPINADVVRTAVNTGQIVRSVVANSGLALMGKEPTLSISAKDGSKTLLLYSLEGGVLAIVININRSATPPSISFNVLTDLSAIANELRSILNTYAGSVQIPST